MEGAVTAKNECRFWFVGGVKLVSREEIYARQFKLANERVLGSKSEKGNGTHAATLA